MTSMLFLMVVPGMHLLASFLVIVGVTCLGSSFVILNSFLPLLVANHPLAQEYNSPPGQDPAHIPMESMPPAHMDSALEDHDDDDQPSEYPKSKAASKAGSLELQLSTKISSKGVGIGYLAAVFVQCLSILLLYSTKRLSSDSSSQTLPLRLVLLLVGLWWFAFMIPSALWLRSRPGPPLRVSVPQRGILSFAYLGYVSFAWASLWKTIKAAAKLRQVAVFLIAWFLLSDAIGTVSGTAILFARTELHMDTVSIAILSITATTSGIAGAFTWPIISRRLALKNNQTIIACMILMEVIPVYGLMGYLPFVKAWGVGGLQQAWEIYPLGFIHGFVMGGLSSYCRSFFGLLIPPDREAAFYALYAITDKGSSAVGPAIVGAIVDATGTIRPAFAFLAVLIALPVPLMWMVDAEQGREDALKMAGPSKLEGRVPESLDDIFQESEGLLGHDD
jgi:MFS transporter, UMF1 family